MKRLHISVGSSDVDKSVAFYSALFGMEPTMRREDYAKWMLEDPRVNFVVNGKSPTAGVDHLGIQVETARDLDEVTGRLTAAEQSIEQQETTACCYHVSDKTWSTDPQGVAWETFLTKGESTVYGNGRPQAGSASSGPVQAAENGEACCGQPASS